MGSISNKKIRRIYYFGNLAILVLMAVSLTVPVMSNLIREYERKAGLLSENIINLKKLYIQTIILEKIAEIENMRSETFIQTMSLAEFERDSLAVLFRLTFDNAGDSRQSGKWDEHLLGLSTGDHHYYLYDRTGEKILLSSLDRTRDELILLGSNSHISSSVEINDDIQITVFMLNDDFSMMVQEKARRIVRNSRLSDDGYIWVNSVLNYSGGDDYAIREVHPNLPDTEGSFLSTNSTDIKGNPLYLEELEGINADGEVFYQYYFKKMNSEKVSQKLSYAKLYKDFDWIIATGVYLDDVDLLIHSEKIQMRESFFKDISFIVMILVIVFVFAAFALISFEMRIGNLIYNKTSELYRKNLELSAEKKKVDEAYSEIHKIAFLDPLTGLWNRRAMVNRFQEEMSRSKRVDKNFCLIICDVDFFKSVNDSYGHSCGDSTLVTLSEILKENIREEDSASRWGGEEFLILLTNSDLVKGASVAEKLRVAVELNEFNCGRSFFHITMTFGVSEFSTEDRIDDVIKSADDKLYYGKRHGRNCVVSDNV